MTEPFTLLNPTTIYSLLSTIAILLTSYLITIFTIPSTSPHHYVLLWHTFDTLIHLLLELPFVYISLFSPGTPSQILSHKDSKHLLCLPHYPNISGASFNFSPLGLLWQEYSRADSRWGWGDATVVSIELITAVGAGPLAMYICIQLIRLSKKTTSKTITINERKKEERKIYFWILILAIAEFYGGYMTFMPEWIMGSPYLNTSNWMYLWVYLILFNGLWVVADIWMACKAWKVLVCCSEGEEGEEEREGKKRV